MDFLASTRSSSASLTSDMQEQLIILGVGGLRVSAREFYGELKATASLIRETAESYMK